MLKFTIRLQSQTFVVRAVAGAAHYGPLMAGSGLIGNFNSHCTSRNQSRLVVAVITLLFCEGPIHITNTGSAWLGYYEIFLPVWLVLGGFGAWWRMWHHKHQQYGYRRCDAWNDNSAIEEENNESSDSCRRSRYPLK